MIKPEWLCLFSSTFMIVFLSILAMKSHLLAFSLLLSIGNSLVSKIILSFNRGYGSSVIDEINFAKIFGFFENIVLNTMS